MSGRAAAREVVMLRRLAVILLVAATALVPSMAWAQDNGNESDRGFILRVNGPLRIDAGERIGSAMVIRGDADVRGTVRDTLIVINGDAVVSGGVEGDVVMIRGDLTVQRGGEVHNVTLVRGSITEEEGSRVTGDVHRQTGIRFGFVSTIFLIAFWGSMTIGVLLLAMLFAGLSGRQLMATGETLTRDLGPSIAAAFAVWVALPVLIVLAFLSVLGIPFGIGLLLIGIPLVWLAGYIVAAARLGALIVKPEGSAYDRPYLSALVGVLILQVVALVPVIGALIALVAGFVGSGALAVQTFRGGRGTGMAAAPPAPQGTPAS
jgi:cytoskeletal protein CcmA (bactofilin family)